MFFGQGKLTRPAAKYSDSKWLAGILVKMLVVMYSCFIVCSGLFVTDMSITMLGFYCKFLSSCFAGTQLSSTVTTLTSYRQTSTISGHINGLSYLQMQHFYLLYADMSLKWTLFLVTRWLLKGGLTACQLKM